MGLDAVVYKHRSKLPMDPELAGLQMEPNTHEWYPVDDQLPEPIRSVGVQALHHWLGNLSSIRCLYAQVASMLPADSVLLANVLYGGAHCGDVISLDRVSVLKREISVLRNSGGSPLSSELELLLERLDQLVDAAEDNQNPIVFV